MLYHSCVVFVVVVVVVIAVAFVPFVCIRSFVAAAAAAVVVNFVLCSCRFFKCNAVIVLYCQKSQSSLSSLYLY